MFQGKREMQSIDDESQLKTRLLQMNELLGQEKSAIVGADTDLLGRIAVKKQELTNILATVPSEMLRSLRESEKGHEAENRKELLELIARNSAKNSINGSMLTQARNMTEKSIGILLNCTERNPVELYDEQGKVPDPNKKRVLGAA